MKTQQPLRLRLALVTAYWPETQGQSQLLNMRQLEVPHRVQDVALTKHLVSDVFGRTLGRVRETPLTGPTSMWAAWCAR